MLAGSFKRKAVPPADGDLDRQFEEIRGTENSELRRVKSISSAGVVVIRIQVSVIARISGCRLPVRSLSAVTCEGVSMQQALTMYSKRCAREQGQGLRCMTSESKRSEIWEDRVRQGHVRWMWIYGLAN